MHMHRQTYTQTCTHTHSTGPLTHLPMIQGSFCSKKTGCTLNMSMPKE